MQTIGDVVEGDLIDFDYVPEKGTVILRNGKPVAEPIPGKALYDAVLAIWLGDKPSTTRSRPACSGSEFFPFPNTPKPRRTLDAVLSFLRKPKLFSGIFVPGNPPLERPHGVAAV